MQAQIVKQVLNQSTSPVMFSLCLFHRLSLSTGDCEHGVMTRYIIMIISD